MRAYRTGQEGLFGAFSLVLNAAVRWTTHYLDDAVEHLQSPPRHKREHDGLDEEVARLSLRPGAG